MTKGVKTPAFLKGHPEKKSKKELECEEWEEKYFQHFGERFGIARNLSGAPKDFDEMIDIIKKCIDEDKPFEQGQYNSGCIY